MRAVCTLIGAMLLSTPVSAQEWKPFPSNAAFETGDTWTVSGQRFRLYGVQACLRGTKALNPAGVSLDCGEASITLAAAFIRDVRPNCANLGRSDGVTYVSCYADIRGNRIELGAALIAQGFAFAALMPVTENGNNVRYEPVNKPYFVIEQDAKTRHAGLWAFKSFDHPNAVLIRAAKTHGTN